MTARSCGVDHRHPGCVDARRAAGVGAVGAQQRGLGVHLGHRLVGAADHANQRVGGIVAGHQQQALEQLARGVGDPGRHAGAVALDPGVGLGGHDRRIERHLVQDHLRQKRFDRAGRRRRRVLVTCGQHLPGVHVGDDPRRRRPGRNRRGAGGASSGSASATGAATRARVTARHVRIRRMAPQPNRRDRVGVHLPRVAVRPGPTIQWC